MVGVGVVVLVIAVAQVDVNVAVADLLGAGVIALAQTDAIRVLAPSATRPRKLALSPLAAVILPCPNTTQPSVLVGTATVTLVNPLLALCVASPP
jgi:hypothetical protein